MRVAMCVMVCLMLAGCLNPYGMNMESQQERKFEESQAAQAVAKTKLDLKGPGPISVTQTGEGATATIAPPEPTTVLQEETRGTSSTTEGKGEEKSWFEGKSPWTLILIGVGAAICLVVAVFTVRYILVAIKSTATGRAVLAKAEQADSAFARGIDSLSNVAMVETDPVKIASIQARALALERERTAAWDTAMKVA